MIDTVKPKATAVWIIPGPFSCTSVDPEGAAQARTFQYIVVCSNKSNSKVLDVSFSQQQATAAKTWNDSTIPG